MRRRCRVKIRVLALILFLLAMPGAALRGTAQEPTTDSPSAVAAKQIIQELVAGQFEKVEAIYDARMKEALPPGKLADGWRDLNKQAGAFQAITSTETSQVQGLQVATLQCKFEIPSAPGAARAVDSASVRQAGLVQRAAAHFGEREIRITWEADGAGWQRAISSRGSGAGRRTGRSGRNGRTEQTVQGFGVGACEPGHRGVPLHQAHAEVWRAE